MSLRSNVCDDTLAKDGDDNDGDDESCICTAMQCNAMQCRNNPAVESNVKRTSKFFEKMGRSYVRGSTVARVF